MTRRNQKQVKVPATVDLIQEALRLARSARSADLELRLLGSTAVAARCEAARDLLRRHHATPKDIDLAGLGHQRRRVRDFLYGQGLRPPDNGLMTPYMDRDLFLTRRSAQLIRVEVFFDELRFVHRIAFGDDFARSFPTLPIETLIMSKLQMRLRALSDWLHLAALLIQCATELRNGKEFNATRITKLTACDYRCWRDFRSALEHLSAGEILKDLGLTPVESLSMNEGIGHVASAVGAARHGARWWLGRVKAFFRMEPPEPEIAEYWEAG